MSSTLFHEAPILIIDDSRELAELLQEILRLEGYKSVSICLDSREALDKILESPPKLVLIDLYMPHIDGLTLIAKINDAGLASVKMPVVMLTAETSKEIKVNALQLGVSDFISKPFNFLEINTRIQNLLHKSWLYTELEKQNQLLEQRVERRTEELSTINAAIREQNTKLKEIAWIQSHVVRAPLARFIGIVSLLKAYGARNAAEMDYFLQLSIDSAQELDQIIRDITLKSHESHLNDELQINPNEDEI
jgi:DNA-binding response OmpR family regulator